MSYEYKINDNLSNKYMEDILIKSKVFKRNYLNLFTTIYVIFLAIVIVFGYILDKSIYTIWVNIFLCASIVLARGLLLLGRDKGIRNCSKLIDKIRYKNQCIQFQNNKYMYISDNLELNLTKSTVIEILKDEEYTYLFVSPKWLKYIFFMDPIIVPNNLFGSEEKYNKFINSISK